METLIEENLNKEDGTETKKLIEEDVADCGGIETAGKAGNRT